MFDYIPFPVFLGTNFSAVLICDIDFSLARCRRTFCLSVCLFVFGATAPSGTGPHYSRSYLITHNDAPQSVGLLWTSDQLVAEISTWQDSTFKTDKHPWRRWDVEECNMVKLIFIDFGKEFRAAERQGTLLRMKCVWNVLTSNKHRESNRWKIDKCVERWLYI